MWVDSLMHDTWSPNRKQVDWRVDQDLRLSPQKWTPKSYWLHFAKQASFQDAWLPQFYTDILYYTPRWTRTSFFLAPTSARANPSPWTPCLWKPENAPWWLLVRRSNLAHPRSSIVKRTCWSYVFHIIKEKIRNSMQGPGNIQRSLGVKGYVPKPKSEILDLGDENTIRVNQIQYYPWQKGAYHATQLCTSKQKPGGFIGQNPAKPLWRKDSAQPDLGRVLPGTSRASGTRETLQTRLLPLQSHGSGTINCQNLWFITPFLAFRF